MPILKICTFRLGCDVCDRETDYPYHDREYLIERSRKAGWKVTKNNVLCPDHVEWKRAKG